MTKFIPYAVIAVLIVGAVVVISGKLKNQPSYEAADLGQSAIPVSQIKLDTKTSIDSAIDAELGQMDKELQGVSGADFDASGLSDTKLGL